MNILVIEDDIPTQNVIIMLCQGVFNHQCIAASSLQVGIQKLLKDRPDFILLDLLLVGEISTPIINLARSTYKPSPKIAIMTAMHDGWKIAQQFNADYFIQKPFDIEILDKIINKQLKNNNQGILDNSYKQM